MDKFTVNIAGAGRVAVGCVQHKGSREYQEDSFGFSRTDGEPQERFLAVVADGMGGMASGAFVSGWTVRRMLEADIGAGEAPIPVQLREAARRISGEIAEGGSRGGSTLAAVLCCSGGVYICSVGDSRVYLQRGGALARLTMDGDYMDTLLGRVISGELTMLQAAADTERGSLVQFMGGGVNIVPDVNRLPFIPQKGDRLLICSDGVYNALPKETIMQSLTLTAGGAAEDILGRVLAKGYTNQDNLTAVVLEFMDDFPEMPENIQPADSLSVECSCYTSEGGCNHNEDSMYCGGGIYAVADGLGGHKGGATASAAAVKYLSGHSGEAMTPQGMTELFKGANDAVHRLGKGLTTVAAGALSGGDFICGNVGDSRVYYFRQGRLIYQTRDHSVCQAAVELGQLDPEQIRGSEDRSALLKALGSTERLELKRLPEQIPAQPGDAFLICTDGFWEHVHEREMEYDLMCSAAPQKWRDRMLKRLLLASGGSGDNYTVVCGFVTDRAPDGDNAAAGKRTRRKHGVLLRLLISAAAALFMLGWLAAALAYLSGGESEPENPVRQESLL